MAILNELGLQLWSVKDDTAKDFFHALKDVKALGYTGVEFAGFADHTATEVKEMLEKVQIKNYGAHVGIDALREDLQKVIDDYKLIGTPYIIVPWYDFASKEATIEFAKELEKYATEIEKHGMKLAYHNHDQEFVQFDGEYIMDIVLNNTTKVYFEIDIFWTHFAGIDTESYINKHKNKIVLMHLKQIGKENKNCQFDEGLIDMKKFIQLGQRLNVEKFIVEQEEYTRPELETLKSNVEYINKL